MKKNLLKCTAILLASVMMLPSCSNEEIDTEIIKTENVLTVSDMQFRTFLCSVDSLNACYPSHKTRGSFYNGAGVGLADYIGGSCGGTIGRWAGGAIGSLSGNPIGTIMGSIIGRRVGPAICSAIASGLANMLLSCESTSNGIRVLQLKSDFSFTPLLDSESDSLGYYHNLVMVKLLDDADKYGFGTSSINCDLVYDDVVKYYKEFGIYNAELEQNQSLKAAIIAEIQKICQPAILYETGQISESQMIELNSAYLQSTCKFTVDEINTFKKFTGELTLKCASLEEDQLRNYSSNLSKVIQTSSLPQEKKVELAKTSQTIINSTLCWQQ